MSKDTKSESSTIAHITVQFEGATSYQPPLQLDVPRDASIAAIKERIYKESKIAISDQTLYYGAGPTQIAIGVAAGHNWMDAIEMRDNTASLQSWETGASVDGTAPYYNRGNIFTVVVTK